MTMLESALEARLRKLVRLRLGGALYKLAPTVKGMPDRMVLLPGGRIYLVELKTSTGRVSDIQRAWHDRAASLGTHVVVLSGLDQIDRWVGARSAEIHDDGETKRKYARTPAQLREDPVPCGEAAVHAGHEWSYGRWGSTKVVEYWCSGRGSVARR
jgi:hypothetical protein